MEPWNFGEIGSTFDPMAGFGGPASGYDSFAPPALPPGGVPEQIAGHLASQGIRPQQFFSSPPALPAPMLPPGGNVWDAAPMAPGGAPGMNARAEAPMVADPRTVSPADMSTSTQTPANMVATASPNERIDNFLKGLAGVKMPTAPTPQRVETPRPGQPHAPQKISPQLVALLQSMGHQQRPAGLRLG